MFASAWQLLTAIFFFSALTKLVYKLIKEDRTTTTTTTRRIVVVRTQQQQREQEARALEQHQAEEQLEPQQHQQQQQQVPDAASEASFVRHLTGSSSSNAALGQRQEERAVDEEEELDEDDEFEDTLSWAFQSQSERAELEEQRRTRWLTRQQFRRQLNRLNVQAVGATGEEEDEEESEPEVEEPTLGLDLSGLSQASFDQQQQSPTSSGEYFDANDCPLSTSGQNAAQQQQQQVASQGDQTQQASAFVDFYAAAPEQDDNSCKLGLRRLGGRIGSVEQLSGWTQKKFASEKQQDDYDRTASAAERATNLTKLIGEAFLIEPLKLTCAILGQTFRTFCAFLDFIEGIETAQTSQTAETTTATTTTVTGGGNQSELAHRKLRAHKHQLSNQSATRRLQQQQQAARSDKRRSNYFHRRYLSRRSLSAALLNDSDRDEPADSTS